MLLNSYEFIILFLPITFFVYFYLNSKRLIIGAKIFLVLNGLNQETKYKKFIPSKLLNYYFLKLLKLAKTNNIKVYYFTMPFNKSSYKKILADFKNQYNDYIYKISLKYNIKLCNKIFYMENNFFGDSSHLYKGTNINTNKIYNCIKD
jgi:hypothetical protein